MTAPITLLAIAVPAVVAAMAVGRRSRRLAPAASAKLRRNRPWLIAVH